MRKVIAGGIALALVSGAVGMGAGVSMKAKLTSHNATIYEDGSGRVVIKGDLAPMRGKRISYAAPYIKITPTGEYTITIGYCLKTYMGRQALCNDPA